MVRCPTGNRCGLWVQARSLWTGRRCPPFARRILLNRCRPPSAGLTSSRSEEHTSELQSRLHLVCRLLLEKKKSASILGSFTSYYSTIMTTSELDVHSPNTIQSAIVVHGPYLTGTHIAVLSVRRPISQIP